MSLHVLGVMTGTSCDGLDAACLEFDRQGRWKPGWTATAPYPRALRLRVLQAQVPGTRWPIRDWLELDRDLGDWYAQVLSRWCLGEKKRGRKPDLIANHGQTVAHFPGRQGCGFTLQLGDPTRLAACLGISVAAFFRHGDMAAGGQGAPLVPRFHRELAKRLTGSKRGIAIHNLGGISNLTYLSPAAAASAKGVAEVLAFDTGPANLWIDAAAAIASQGRAKIDRGGRMAAQGRVDARALRKLLEHPFLREAPPKSTGRDDFPIEVLLEACPDRGNDLVATATAFTLESIGAAYERWILNRGHPLERIYLCGGGTHNPRITQGLAKRLPSVKFAKLEAFGFDPQFIESQAFAFFGYLALRGNSIGGSWTGAKTFGPPAHLVPGANWAGLLRKLGRI